MSGEGFPFCFTTASDVPPRIIAELCVALTPAPVADVSDTQAVQATGDGLALSSVGIPPSLVALFRR